MPAELQHAVPIAFQDSLFLFFRHRPLVQVSTLVRLETGAVLRLHQRHAEHVEVVAFARLVCVEHHGSGQIVIVFGKRHRRSLFQAQYSRIGLSTSSPFCRPTVLAIFGMTSTRTPSSGASTGILGCGQSVPHNTRSGNPSTSARAKGTTSS